MGLSEAFFHLPLIDPLSPVCGMVDLRPRPLLPLVLTERRFRDTCPSLSTPSWAKIVPSLETLFFSCGNMVECLYTLPRARNVSPAGLFTSTLCGWCLGWRTDETPFLEADDLPEKAGDPAPDLLYQNFGYFFPSLVCFPQASPSLPALAFFSFFS